jgi:hypothetical protein
MTNFVTTKAISPFINNNLREMITSPISGFTERQKIFGGAIRN